MTYELALELKNAGFPQEPSGEVNELFGDTRHSDYILWKEDACSPTVTASTNEYLSGIERGDVLIKLSTLEELIEACGDRISTIMQRTEPTQEWRAWAFTLEEAMGATTSEAVANLWLALK